MILEINKNSKEYLIAFLKAKRKLIKEQKRIFILHLQHINYEAIVKRCNENEQFCQDSGYQNFNYDENPDKVHIENLNICEYELNEMIEFSIILQKKIESMKYIIEKEFYSPLENFLLNGPEYAQKALKKLTNTEIDYSNDPKIFKTSNLSHLFSNYSNYVVYMKNNLEVQD